LKKPLLENSSALLKVSPDDSLRWFPSQSTGATVTQYTRWGWSAGKKVTKGAWKGAFSSDAAHSFHGWRRFFTKNGAMKFLSLEDLKMLWKSVLPSNPLPKEGF
jgi:hypothetical protein